MANLCFLEWLLQRSLSVRPDDKEIKRFFDLIEEAREKAKAIIKDRDSQYNKGEMWIRTNHHLGVLSVWNSVAEQTFRLKGIINAMGGMVRNPDEPIDEVKWSQLIESFKDKCLDLINYASFLYAEITENLEEFSHEEEALPVKEETLLKELEE